MVDAVWLIPALPLAGFLVLLIAGKRLGDPTAGYLATAAIGASFLTTVLVFFALLAADLRADVNLAVLDMRRPTMLIRPEFRPQLAILA